MNIIDYQLKSGRIHGKETLKSEANRTVRLLIITLSMMIIVLSIMFLTLTSEGAQKGYTLEQLKLKNQELKNEQNELSTKVTNSTSFNNLGNNEKIEEMQKSEIRDFVTGEDNKVN